MDSREAMTFTPTPGARGDRVRRRPGHEGVHRHQNLSIDGDVLGQPHGPHHLVQHIPVPNEDRTGIPRGDQTQVPRAQALSLHHVPFIVREVLNQFQPLHLLTEGSLADHDLDVASSMLQGQHGEHHSRFEQQA